MADRVRALCMEYPQSGGNQLQPNPVEVDPKEDGLDGRAFFVQNGTSADSTAYVSRATGAADLTLTDTNAGTKRLQDLVSVATGATSNHAALPDMAHFLGAPADGWVSPFFVPIYTGPLLTARTWYTSSKMTQPIFRQVLTYAGPLIATVVSTVFGPTGAQVKQTTDTYSYNGPIVAGIARSSV